MVVASKILKTLDASCHEFMHPWVSSCCDASAGVLIHSIQASFRIYVTTYMVLYLILMSIVSIFKLCIINFFHLKVDFTDERSKANQKGT